MSALELAVILLVPPVAAAILLVVLHREYVRAVKEAVRRERDALADSIANTTTFADQWTPEDIQRALAAEGQRSFDLNVTRTRALPDLDCGHSACVQNYINTGNTCCVAGEAGRPDVAGLIDFECSECGETFYVAPEHYDGRWDHPPGEPVCPVCEELAAMPEPYDARADHAYERRRERELDLAEVLPSSSEEPRAFPIMPS
jgi:hypothetical protein